MAFLRRKVANLMSSGPNQHYIPKFVQKPFSIPPRRHQIWCFARGTRPDKRTIKRTGSQDHFYSLPAAAGSRTLDDEITSVENRLSSVLHTIRSIPIGNSVDSHDAAAIIAHLAPRTAHIRNSLKHGLTQILDHATALFNEPNNLQALVGLDQSTPNDQFRKHVFDDLINRPELAGLNLPTHVLERVAFYFAKENASEFLNNTLPLLHPILTTLLSGSDNIVRDSHIKALVKNLKYNPRVTVLRTMSWTIQSAPTSGAILPDCVVIAINKEGETTSLMLVEHDNISAIILPVSPKKLLVGSTDEYTIPQTFNYNVEAARVSYRFVLSSCNDAETTRLHPLIAERSTSILDEAVENAVQDLLPKRFPSRPENDIDKPEASYGPIDLASREFQYELSFVGCGGQEAIQGISDHLQTIVSALSQVLPLKRLDGVTIAEDYPEALVDLDRGFENAPAVETVSREVGVGVAQMVTLMRSDEVKGRIVISSAIAHALTSNNAKDAEFGLYVVVRELASVAMIEIIEGALPGVMLSPVESKLNGWLYANVDAALHAYVASYIAAGSGNERELVEAKRQLLADGLNRMKDTVLKERLAYRYHGVLDKLLAVALPSVRQILIFSADLLDHSAGAGLPPFQGPDELHISLEQAGLQNWLEMYRVDLERFYNRLGRWESFDEFLFFNVHVERLLWQLGILPWEGTEGIRIEIPLGTDAATLPPRG